MEYLWRKGCLTYPVLILLIKTILFRIPQNHKNKYSTYFGFLSDCPAFPKFDISTSFTPQFNLSAILFIHILQLICGWSWPSKQENYN